MTEPTTGEPRRPRHSAQMVTEAVHDLITPRRHRQPYRAAWKYTNRTRAVIRDHVTDHESLIGQLREAIVDRADTQSGAKAGQVPVSTLPRFSVDAFDRMERIRLEVTEWCERLNIPLQGRRDANLIGTYLDAIEKAVDNAMAMSTDADRAIGILRAVASVMRNSVEPDLRRLASAAPTMDQDDLDDLGMSAERWRTWCRIMTGWQDAALRPHVPCPECGALAGEREGLRIRIEAAGGTGGIKGDAAARAAVCLSCNRTWDADHFGLLAAQLRAAGSAL